MSSLSQEQMKGGEGDIRSAEVQRLLRVLAGVLGPVPLVDGGQLGQGERGRQMVKIRKTKIKLNLPGQERIE